MPLHTNVPSTDAGVVKTSPAGRFDQYRGIDDPARLHPGKAAIERGREVRARRGADAERPRALHAVAQLLAEAIDLAVVGPHALPHDARRHPNHVGVAHAAALDDRHDGHSRGELALHGLDAEDPGVGALQSPDHLRGRLANRPGRDRLNQHGIEGGASLEEGLFQARRNLATGLVGDQGHTFLGLNRETGPGRIARAFEQIRRSRSEGHPLNSTSRPGSDLGLTPSDHNLPRRIKRPLTLSARSCITCTAMLVSRTSNADPRTSAATATAPAETAITSRMPTK